MNYREPAAHHPEPTLAMADALHLAETAEDVVAIIEMRVSDEQHEVPCYSLNAYLKTRNGLARFKAK